MTVNRNTIGLTKRLGSGVVAAFVAVALIGCGGGDTDRSKGPGGKGRPGERRAGMGRGAAVDRPPLPAVSVAVETVGRGDIATYYSATASLDPNKQADILARVKGIVGPPLVEEGDVVRQGQVLIEIDDAEYRHRVKQAEVDLDQQRSSLARTEKMAAQGLVSAEDAEAARSRMEAAEATWELAKLELSYTRVRAPFAGRIVARQIDQGRTVSVGTVLFTLADLSRLLARVHVPAREFRNIRTDQPVRLRVDSSGESLEGRILLVSPVVDPAAGTIKVTVAVDRYGPAVRPGDFAEVSIVTDRHEDVLLVPRTAVLTEHEDRVVYVVEGDVAHRRVVEVGFEDDRNAEIMSGLSEGVSVVVRGQRSLSDGQSVTVLEAIDLGAAPGVKTSTEE